MKNVYFCYRFLTEGRGNQYTPSYILKSAYPEWEGKIEICDCQIESNVVTGRRFGMIVCEDSVYEDVKTEVKNNGIAAMMQYMTPNQAIDYMDKLTGYVCTNETPTEKTYCIREAIEDVEKIPAEHLTIIKGDI